MIDRRRFLASSAAVVASGSRTAEPPGRPGFQTRGVVLVPDDLTLADWPERAHQAGLTTIGIHHPHSPSAVVQWVASPPGQRFLDTCRRLGLAVEYELHAMKELLPRDRFARDPELFRQDERGHRNPDANLCPHAPRTLEIVAENAVAIARRLKPTTGRYFLWGDDGLPWCCCRACREFSPSEQALIVENALVAALRRVDPRASVAHLAYTNTLEPPKKVRPDRAVFLEYAPIRRRYDRPYDTQTEPGQPDGLAALDANLAVFPAATAQVLEYWLDVSRFSKWKKPAVALPWRPDVVRRDAVTYASRGIRHVTSFAVYIDADYRTRFGEPDFLREYGACLQAAGSEQRSQTRSRERE